MADQFQYCQNCRKNIAKANYVIHAAHCERRIQLCSLCNEPIPIAEKDQHMEEYHSVGACDLCNERMEKWQMEKHKQDACMKRPFDCKFCELQLPLDELEEHCDMCGARTEKCPFCISYVLRRDLENHNKICKDGYLSIATCEYCQMNVPSILLDEHVASCEAQKDVKCNRCEALVMFKNRSSHICKVQSSSKTHGECPICHSTISWIDMREHEACCRNAIYQSDDEDENKAVSDADNKRPTTQKNTTQRKYQYSDSRSQRRTENNFDLQKMKQCEFCKERFTDLLMDSHAEVCQGRSYKCELCLQTMPFKKKVQHEISECPMIHGANEEFPSNSHGYAASGYTKSYEKKLKDCVYCKIKFPELMFQEHMGVCDERPHQCSLCCKAMPMREKAEHDAKECMFRHKTNRHFSASERDKPKYGVPEKEYFRETGSDRSYPKQKITERDDEKYSAPERKYPKYAGSEKDYSVSSERGNSRDVAVYKRNFEKDSLEINYRVCPYCYNKIPEHKMANHVPLCSVGKKCCQFCGAEIPIEEEIVHVQSCIGARHVVEQPRGFQAPPEPEFQYPGGKKSKNKKKNKKEKDTVPQSPPQKGFFSIPGFSIFSSNKKESPSKPDVTPKRWPSYTPEMPSYTPEMPAMVLLPCEFCEELFPDALIIEHQSGCRPDLVSFPNKEMGPLTKAQSRKLDRDQDDDFKMKTTINVYGGVKNTGAKPKVYPISRTSPVGEYLTKRSPPKEIHGEPKIQPISRTSPVIAPGEYLSRRSPPKEVPSPSLDYFNYPSGVPYQSSQITDNRESKQSKSLHSTQVMQKDRVESEDKKTVKNQAKSSIFNFKSSNRNFGDDGSDNESKSSSPRTSVFKSGNEGYRSSRQGFSEDGNIEHRAIGAERAEKIHTSRDFLVDSDGGFSDISVGAYDSRNQKQSHLPNLINYNFDDKETVNSSRQGFSKGENTDKKGIIQINRDTLIDSNVFSDSSIGDNWNKLSPPLIPSQGISENKYRKAEENFTKRNYSERNFNICSDEDTSNIVELEKVKTTTSTRLLERLENPDFRAHLKKSWDEHRTEDDAKNAETFGDNYQNLNQNFNLDVDNLSDSGEHFYDAEEDLKLHMIEAEKSSSSSPNIDSNMDVYFQFLRKGKDGGNDLIDVKNERTPTPVVESVYDCECGNEICYCAISNQTGSFENNNFLQKKDGAKSGETNANKSPSFDFEAALKKQMLGEGDKNCKTELEKNSLSFTQWRQNELYNSDSD